MNKTRLTDYVNDVWDRSIVPALSEYIRIPNKSVHFDADWAKHGHMDRAAQLMRAWCEANAPAGTKIEVVRLGNLTPLLYVDIPAAGSAGGDCVLMYGHMDKQPEFSGWAEGFAPWTPVLKNGRLYGRGGADDGYAVFASLLAVRALREQDVAHARVVILIEGSEESGSPDLPAYIEALAPRIGEPSLVICLDAECGNYEQLWCTTSLRGNLLGTLRVDVLREGVHSGMASGIVPSSFRVLRQLLARVEDAATGKILVEELQTATPPDRLAQTRATAATLGASVHEKLPFLPGMQPMSSDRTELLLNGTWRPTLSVTGVDGIPALPNAGNVLRPYSTLKLSFRLPPGVDADRAARAVKQTLERDPPYGARVEFHIESSMPGWNAPSTAPWLEQALQDASQNFFGRPSMYLGTGGTIPFMPMLNEKFPRTQFMVTGVLGPQSKAHGPNEFLDIATGKRVTACVAHVIAAHARRG